MTRSTIASLTPTVCDLFRIPPPLINGEAGLKTVGDHARALLGEAAIDRCLVYCPDALGEHIWSRYPAEADGISAVCPQRVRLGSVVPPKTPVCYASIFTGALPESHGIRRYERPVLAVDTPASCSVAKSPNSTNPRPPGVMGIMPSRAATT